MASFEMEAALPSSSRALAKRSFALAAPSATRSHAAWRALLEAHGGTSRAIDAALAHNVPVVDAESYFARVLRFGAYVPPLDDELVAGVEERRSELRAADYDAAHPQTSALVPRVRKVVELLLREQALDHALNSLGVSKVGLSGVGRRLPLAFNVLKSLEQALVARNTTKDDLSRLSKNFYSLVPHDSEPVIDSLETVRKLSKTLEALGYISDGGALDQSDQQKSEDEPDDSAQLAAFNVPRLETADEDALRASTHPLDIAFRRLNVKLTPVARNSSEYDIVQRYAQNSFARAHKHQFRIRVRDVLEVERHGEVERFVRAKGNLRLLWHGSRLANIRGILAQGLRIAPPEAPISGYFLGKGIYLADIFSKSAEYCHASKEEPDALMFLCETALGNLYQTAHGKFIEPDMLEEAGVDSVHGMGLREPRAAYSERLDDVLVPLGKEAAAPVAASELDHSEFVVYSLEQVRLRFLVHVHFEFPPFADADSDFESDPDTDSEGM